MKYFIVLIVFAISLNVTAQTDNENLNEQLNTMKTAFMNKDFAAVADFTYPKLIEMVGGKEKMIEMTQYTYTKMESQGFILKNLSFKDSSDLFNHKGDLQCGITKVMVMDTPDGKTQNETTMIAISKDGGEKWVFFDTSGMSRASAQSLYKNLHPDLEIKPSQKKTLD